VGRRDDRVVDGDALVHIIEVVFFEPYFLVQVHHELDGLVARVVELRELLELAHQAGERVGLVELARSVEGDIGRVGGWQGKKSRDESCAGQSSDSFEHEFLLHDHWI
jgi:hypothetical protein